MIKIIGCDADGILNDLDAYLEWVFNDYYSKRKQPVPTVKNADAYEFHERYEISKAQLNILLFRYFRHYCLHWISRIGTFGTLSNYQKEGRKVYIITARKFATNPFFGFKSRGWFEKWLAKHNFVPNEIIYCSEKKAAEEKAKYCHALKCDLMYEDKPDNIEKILKICDVIAFPTSYNRNYKPKSKKHDFYLADNWLASSTLVHQLDNKK
jgi:uncharacterized HAD superfamily protein